MNANKKLRDDVDKVISNLLNDINPYDATKNCIDTLKLSNGRTILVSIGKAAWVMGKAVSDSLNIDDGVIITKYNHSKGEIKNIKIFEAGHPIVDENSIKASEYALNITSRLNSNDNVILCISGGGSALFEKPLVSLEKLQDINDQLIKSSASINEINAIRKRLSSVKGGRFSLHIKPANIHAIILSDVIGNDLSTIASGPVSIDNTTIDEITNIISKYNINIDEETRKLLSLETPKQIDNVKTYIVGSVEQLCIDTKIHLQELGYDAKIIANDCKDNVVDIAKKFEELLKTNTKPNKAYIIGGESVVCVKGDGKGGRNSELALLCSKFIKEDNVCVFTFGSDGTDGPTDAAGGYVDYNTSVIIDVDSYLENNDSYNGLNKTNGLIITGPTGSNINDVYVLLVK